MIVRVSKGRGEGEKEREQQCNLGAGRRGEAGGAPVALGMLRVHGSMTVAQARHALQAREDVAIATLILRDSNRPLEDNKLLSAYKVCLYINTLSPLLPPFFLFPLFTLNCLSSALA
jgi:hypothetical protein